MNRWVDAGAGSQVLRKLFHLVVASIIPTVYYFAMAPRWVVVSATIIITFVWVGADLMRLANPAWNRALSGFFGVIMKDREVGALTGSSYILLGTSVSLLVFSPAIAVASVYFASLGDPSAALVGSRFGRRRLANGKSLEGGMAMFAVCVLAGILTLGSGVVALAGALTACVTELFCARLDDNLAIPVVCGVVMTLTGWMI